VQVPGGLQAAVEVARADGGHRRRRCAVGVDDHERDPLALKLLLLRLGRAGDDEEDAEGAAVRQRVDPLLRGMMPAAQLREHQVVAGGGGDRLDALDDLHGPLRVELVEDQVDLAGAAGRLPGHPAAVAVPFEAGLDPCAGFGRDVGASVEDLADGSHRHSDLVGDGRDGGGAGSVSGHRNPVGLVP
jgi:hypothetical protein